VNLPLFHGTRPGVLIAVVSMTFSFQMKGSLVCAGCRWSLSDPFQPVLTAIRATANGPPTAGKHCFIGMVIFEAKRALESCNES
jgi:hypothetical protein